MIRFVVGGAICKDEIAKLICEIGGDQVQVSVMTDMQAVLAVQSKQADYYFGACHTGGGGALSMAIALLTLAKCATVSMPGRPPKKEEVVDAVKAGKIAFGFTGDHIDESVTLIMSEILSK